jgi:hypothetical protein
MTIKTPTVLVLGAASSMHCGYPLGTPLIANVVKAHRQGNGIPLPPRWNKDDVDHFTTRLSRSAHYSIDAFLETVPRDTDLGKYLIAYCLKRFENVDHLFPPNNSGWYRDLFNSLLGESRSPFAHNNLAIVTYDHDRSLETYLYNALIARFNLSPEDALTELHRIPIIHVHGQLGAFPDIPYESTDDVNTIQFVSQSIKIIHEIRDTDAGFCSPEFQLAHDAITNASKVIFLGFGFHRDNIRRLNVDWSASKDRKVFSTFADMSPQEYKGLIQRLSEHGISEAVLPNTGGYMCENFFRYVTSLE